jgi:hypothetical protein
VWDTLKAYARGPVTLRIMDALVTLYGIAYTPSARDKRKWLLYYGVSLCCEPVDLNIPMVSDKSTLDHAFEQCSKLFRLSKTECVH